MMKMQQYTSTVDGHNALLNETRHIAMFSFTEFRKWWAKNNIYVKHSVGVLSLVVHCLKKTAPLGQVGINSVIFQIHKIRNIRFVGNFILNKSCEFYYDDVTMTSFIGNWYSTRIKLFDLNQSATEWRCLVWKIIMGELILMNLCRPALGVQFFWDTV